MQPHRAWAEIDLDALTHNLAVIRKRAGPGTRILLVVKADAYGHGADLIAHHALRAGIGALGVGTSQEALQLRAMGIDLPILVLGTVIETELAACLRMEIHIGLHTLDRCLQLERSRPHIKRRACVVDRPAGVLRAERSAECFLGGAGGLQGAFDGQNRRR